MNAVAESVGLFNRFKLIAAPSVAFLMCSTEDDAAYLDKILPPSQYIATTWPSNEYAWCDLGPLLNRTGLLIANSEPDDIIAMHAMAKRLLHIGCKLRWTDTSRETAGWVAQDAPSDWEAFKAWAKARTTDYAPPNPSLPASSIPPPKSETESPSLPDGDGPDIPLEAYDGDGEGPPAPVPLSEMAFAQHFADRHGQNWRCVRAWGKWFYWDGDAWTEDRKDSRVKPMRDLFLAAQEWPVAKQLNESSRRALLGRKTPIYSALIVAGTDARIAALPEQWDADPWLLGVPGGVIELKTGKMRKARPEDYITKKTAVAPAEGDAPLWRHFLETVTNENGELIEFLQRFVGYSLTGDTREQCFSFLYGTGQNGKGVFITTIAKILGAYAVTADADVFMESDHNRHPTEMARLHGARLVTVDETDNAKRWNEKRIKRLTGGGKIEARFMRQDDFEFVPQFKLILAGNHKPQLRGVGKAIQRRIHLVPFTVTIPDSERDTELPQKLEAEYPQILQWIIEGCMQWQKQGLKPPRQILDATAHYIEAEDTVGEWLEECTQQGPNNSVERPAAYKRYRAWCDGRGERAWSSKAFFGALEEKGYNAKKSGGLYYLHGISLKMVEPPSWTQN